MYLMFVKFMSLKCVIVFCLVCVFGGCLWFLWLVVDFVLKLVLMIGCVK